MDANTSNGRVVKLDYKLIDDVPTLPGEFGDSGDDAIRRILQGNTPEARRALTAISSETPTFRLLTDDGKFFGQLKADGSFKEGALAKYHMKTMPYQGSFEFLKLSLGSNRLWQISETAKAPRE